MTHSGPDHEQPHAVGHRSHGWLMMACCIPMLVIAAVLVISGVASSGLLLTAVLCATLMAVMMGLVMKPDRPQSGARPPR